MSSNRNLRLVVAFAPLLAIGVICAVAHGEESQEPAPVYWKQSVFFIPYQINRPATADDAPLEVRLLVSRDAGANWQTLQSAQPHVKGFTYNAEKEDGHYWFAVQTVDRFGREHPAKDIQPELHVVVDTAPPRLEVEAQVDAKGDVVIHCRQEDANLDVDKLSVNVQPENGRPEPLQVPEGEAEGSNQLAHQMTCVPPLGARLLTVRAETSDRAGNRGIAQIEVDVVAAQQRPVDSGAQPLASDPPSGQNLRAVDGAAAANGSAWSPAVSNASYPQARLGLDSQHRGMSLEPPPLSGGAASATIGKNGQSWPVDRTAMSPPQSASPPATTSATAAPDAAAGRARGFEQLPPPPIASPGPTWSAQQASTQRPVQAQLTGAPGANSGAAALPQADTAEPGPRLQASGSAVSPIEEIGTGEVVRPVDDARVLGGYPDTGAPTLNMAWPGDAPPPSDQAAAPSNAASAPAGWQMVHSRTIAIDYEVASVGPWGVSAVELWGTTDGGQSWRQYAIDEDNRSPVTATVEGEGDYGFRVLVHSAGGFAAAPPASGDAPEALVRVDLVRPEATLESVEQGTGNLADQIMIRWSASDAQLAPQPVTLYYAAQPAGPWSIVAANLVNSGSYAWRADRHLPEQLYVRLEVRDAAGNTTTFQTAQPVVINRPRPQVRIREIRSFDEAAVQSPQ